MGVVNKTEVRFQSFPVLRAVVLLSPLRPAAGDCSLHVNGMMACLVLIVLPNTFGYVALSPFGLTVMSGTTSAVTLRHSWLELLDLDMLEDLMK